MRLVILALLIGYGVGAWKFWSGYNRTNFSPSLPSRLALSMLWPILFAVNSGYRKNFQKALKGR
jgi:hypothetical protein